ncbi:MAG TPA: hypothetical protein VFD70_04725 [Anaerolineae bacterium]|nr:hypothetical protein [Anaerolineae bacterium]
MKTNGKLFTLREVEDLMARRYEVTRRFGSMSVGDVGSIVDVRQQAVDGYLLIFGAPKRDNSGAYKLAPITPREMLFLRLVEVQEPVDVLVTCGEEFWASPQILIDEIKRMGFSHRIPNNFDARRIRRGISRAFLGHNRAVMQIGKGNYDAVLAYLAGVAEREVQEILQREYIHEPSRILDLPPASRNKICKRFRITFEYGIFGYVYLTGCTYYVKPNEESVPEELAARGYRGVRATHIQEQAVREHNEKEDA